MVGQKRVHWIAARHIPRYLRDTVEYGLSYTSGDGVRLCGFTDADWASSLVDRKSTSGCCFNIGLGVVSWCSRKQKLVALSSAEVEYMAVSTTTCKTIWVRKLLLNLFGQRMEATSIFNDN